MSSIVIFLSAYGYSYKIDGDAADNNITAGVGNDYFSGGGGRDTLNGGAGLDTVDYAASREAVTVDVISGFGYGGDAEGDRLSNIEKFIGSSQATDTLSFQGTNQDAIINLSTGSAKVPDVIAFSGFENVIGGSGNDRMTGDGKANKLEGGLGNDTLVGGMGADTLDGGDGNNAVSYESSTQAVVVSLLVDAENTGGEATGDKLLNIQNLTGSNGADILTGNAYNNILFGGKGDDTLIGGEGADNLNGGDDIDTADYSATNQAVSINMVTGVGAGGHAQDDRLISIEKIAGSTSAEDTLNYADSNTFVKVSLADKSLFTGFENISGSNFNDEISGDANANKLEGGTGNDFLSGANGSDILNGGSGNDTLVGGAGSDTLTGGGGVDTASYAAATGAVTVSLATGSGTQGDANGDVLIGISNLIGSAFADNLTGDGVSNTIAGGAGADTIDGGLGNDTVDYSASTAAVSVNLSLTMAQSAGDAAGDVLTSIEKVIGSNYADSIWGSTGNDTLIGGAGNDTFHGSAGADSIYGGTLTAAGGVDTVNYSASTSAVSVDLTKTTAQSGGDAAGDILFNISNLVGSDSGDTLTGTTAANTLSGGKGDDTIMGGGGTDSLVGGDGKDSLTGGTAADTFDLATGNASLAGDKAIGGGGGDTFIINAAQMTSIDSSTLIQGAVGGADTLKIMGTTGATIDLTALTNTDNFVSINKVDVATDGVASIVQLNSASIQNLVDGGNGSVLTLALGGSDNYTIMSETGVYVTDTRASATFYSDAAKTVQIAQVLYV